ncbi:putative n-acetylglucosamine-induced protein [Botrytis fragariae]|uniref:Putative n-acetylglucosamine-induced protein n=1 Tax=Botrytis fragariae TaxID=1964551 RepID=A0A8H6B3W7_9HELO|nr:putative n-acetylglucosamine-induced protein [Botrytis fragariae]KAF5878660.1 putative n-acetylglucosamine-induced protein [Botrytis fragariae]
MGSITPTPCPAYWQTNIPPSAHTPHCPPSLQSLSQKDIRVLLTPDSASHILTWPIVRHIIRTNRLDLFQRKPSQLRKYLEYCYAIKQTHGSMMRFILDEKLHWKESELDARDAPFSNEDEYKILINDWPYGIDEKIVHLVVWTKFALEDDPETGDTRDDVKREIQAWVDRVFGGGENVIWFRNWRSLKSIHSVEHFHVMLYDPAPEFVKEVTGSI